jgi:STE24 endopeptidase
LPPARRRLALAALVVAGGALVWVAAAAALWRSSVPDLRLPTIDPHRAFTEEQLDRTARLEGFLRVDFLLSQLALVLALGLYALRGHRLARESAAGPIGTGMLLGMLGLGLLWFVQVPFDLAAHWWERRNDVASDGYVERLFSGWLALGGAFLFICLALLIVMGLASAVGNTWWVSGSAVFTGLAMLFAFVFPYLSPSEPLREWDPGLAAEARRLAAIEGVENVPVRVEEVSDFTDDPNAWAGGIAGSRRVVLWDTLLDGRFDDDEVAVVVAHEFGHQAHQHIWKSIGWYALFAVPGALLIAAATRRFGGMAAPRAVPVGLFVLVVLQLAALPLQNMISRRLEREADWSALKATRDPDAARSLFRQFTTISLAQPDPPRWASVLLDSHPTVLERMEMAEAWRLRERAAR